MKPGQTFTKVYYVLKQGDYGYMRKDSLQRSGAVSLYVQGAEIFYSLEAAQQERDYQDKTFGKIYKIAEVTITEEVLE